MATRYWSPTADGVFTTAANWLDAAGAPSGAAPGNSDTLIFNQGSASVTGGLSGSLTGLTIIGMEGYSGNIGAYGTALTQTSFADIQWAGTGLHFAFSGAVTKMKTSLQRNAWFYCTGGAWGGNGQVLDTGGNGWILFAAACTFAHAGTTIRNNGPNWVVENGTDTVVPTIINEYGDMRFSRNFGLVINGTKATFRADGDATSASPLYNFGTYFHHTTATDLVAHAMRGSQIIPRGTKAANPTIATLYRSAGSIIQQDQVGAQLAITTDVPLGDFTHFAVDRMG